MENHAKNVHQKLAQDPFYFGKQPKTAIACKKFFQKEDTLKGHYQKSFKKLTLFFLLNPVLCGSISTVFFSRVLLCVSSIIS